MAPVSVNVPAPVSVPPDCDRFAVTLDDPVAILKIPPLSDTVPVPVRAVPLDTTNVPPPKSTAAPDDADNAPVPDNVPPPRKLSTPVSAWIDPVSVKATLTTLVPVPPVLESVPSLTNVPPDGEPPLAWMVASSRNLNIDPNVLSSVAPEAKYRP